MPAYNFKGRFAELVAKGTKPHTIRPRRVRPTVVGDVLYLYTGMRTRQCRLLRTTACTAVTHVVIGRCEKGEDHIILAGRFLDAAEITALAKADGFAGAEAFFSFFRATYPASPFIGELITWENTP